MTRRGREFVGNRLRRSPPDRANAVSCGQGAENAARFPHLAHRPAVAHKPHGTAAATGRIDSAFDSGDHQNRQPGTGFSLSPPGTCPNTRNRRRMLPRATGAKRRSTASKVAILCDGSGRLRRAGSSARVANPTPPIHNTTARRWSATAIAKSFIVGRPEEEGDLATAGWSRVRDPNHVSLRSGATCLPAEGEHAFMHRSEFRPRLEMAYVHVQPSVLRETRMRCPAATP